MGASLVKSPPWKGKKALAFRDGFLPPGITHPYTPPRGDFGRLVNCENETGLFEHEDIAANE